MIRTDRPLRRCAYCGWPLDGGNKLVCSEHADLPDLDPDWMLFRMGREVRLDEQLLAALRSF